MMKTEMRIFFATVFFCFALLTGVRAETITFGIVGAESQESLTAKWSMLFEALQQRTGIVVKPVFDKDYQGIVDGMNRGEIQVASFGNRSALDVVDKGQAEVFSQWVDAEGKKGYVSYLVALKNKPWKSFDDVLRGSKKIRFAFGDLKSTSGSLVPQYYLFAQRKIKAEEIFASVSRGNHELNVAAVLAGKVDVATTNSQFMDSFSVKEPKKFARLKTLWTSPLIPQDPLVWRKDLADETKKKLREFLLGFGQNSDERKLLIDRMGLSGFAVSDDNQLLPIRQLDLYRQRQAVEAATDLSIRDQFRRLVEIDAQLAEISAKVRQIGARK